MPHDRLSVGILVALLAYLFLATAAAFVWTACECFSTVQIIFVQNVVSFFCIFPLAARHGFSGLITKQLPTHLLRDFFGVLSYYLYFLAIRYLNLIDAATLNYTSPFFVPLLGWIWLREKVEKQVWWSIVIGFVGVAVILNPTTDIFEFGFVFGISAGVTAAVAMVAVRLLSVKQEPMTRILFYYFSLGTLLSFPFAWVAWVPPTGEQWLALLAIGGCTTLGQILLTIAYRYGTAAFLSPLCYAAVIYNGLAAYFIFHTPLTWRTYLGSALIVFGGTLTYLWKKRPHPIKSAFEAPQKKKPPF